MATMIVGQMYGLAARRDELAAALLELQRAARQEPGCLGYVVGRLLEDPSTFLVEGRFADPAALEAHYASPAFAAFQQAVSGLLARPSGLEVLEVSQASRPLDPTPMDPRQAD